MRWCRDGELGELWQLAGLRGVRFGSLVVRASYADFDDLWSPFPMGVAPSGAFCSRWTSTAASRCGTPFGAASRSVTGPSS